MKDTTQKIEIAVRMAVDVKCIVVDDAQYTFDAVTQCYRIYNTRMTVVVPVTSLVYLHILA